MLLGTLGASLLGNMLAGNGMVRPGSGKKKGNLKGKLFFAVITVLIRKLLSITRNKKEKHDKILMLAKGKRNSIETLVSKALIDMEITHEKCNTILKEKEKYEKMKENLRGIKEKQENTRKIL